MKSPARTTYRSILLIYFVADRQNVVFMHIKNYPNFENNWKKTTCSSTKNSISLSLDRLTQPTKQQHY